MRRDFDSVRRPRRAHSPATAEAAQPYIGRSTTFFQARRARLRLLALGCRILLATAACSLSGAGATPPISPQQQALTPQQLAEASELKMGQTAEQQVSSGKAFLYRLRLEAGQYFHATIEQRGIDVDIVLFAPGGEWVAWTDMEGKRGTENLWALARQSGDYRLTVQVLSQQAGSGTYRVRVEKIAQWASAPAQDRQKTEAQELFFEAAQLRAQGTAESMRKGLEKYQQALSLWRSVNDRSGEANALSAIANVYSQTGDPQKAIEHYLAAFQLLRGSGNDRDLVSVLNNISLVYWRLGQPRKGLEYSLQAVPLSRTLGDRFTLATALNSIGSLYHGLNDWEKALPYFDEALPIFRSLGDKRWEAVVLDNIGFSHGLTGDYQTGLEALHQALTLRREVKDKRGEAYTLDHLAYVYGLIDELEKALDYYSQSIALWRTTTEPSRAAYAIGNIALIYLKKDDTHKALDYYNQALLLVRGANFKQLESQLLSGLGRVYLRMGDKDQALSHFEQALGLQRSIDDRRGESNTLSNLGQLFQQQGNWQRALEHYQEALKMAREMDNKTLEAGMLHHMAVIERHRGNLLESGKLLEATLNIVESLRTKVPGDELRSSYFAKKQTYYEFQIDLLMQIHKGDSNPRHLAEALRANERRRGRALLDSLVEANANIRQGVSPDLLEREHTLQRSLKGKVEAQERLFGGKHTKEEVDTLARDIEALTSEYDQVLAQIRQSSPRYAALTQPVPLPLEAIQKDVLDSGTVLLEYALGDERSYLWAVTSTSIEAFQLPGRDAIESVARRIYNFLTARNQPVEFETAEERKSRLAAAEAGYSRDAAALSQMILGPVANRLHNKRLLIVGDGALEYLPFAALPLPGSPGKRPGPSTYLPLIAKHEVISLPSASVLAALRSEVIGRKPALKTIAVFADPVFDKGDNRVKPAGSAVEPAGQVANQIDTAASAQENNLTKSLRSVQTNNRGTLLPRLPFTRSEAEAIAAFVPPGQSKKALDFDANRAAALNPELSQYRYLHFATHGLLNSAYPRLSGLVLSLIDKEGRDQDGFLLADEVYNLNLPAEMVVLSGCKTGLGKEVKGEGLLGLTRGFMYAGAERVVVSLWDVNDKATAELMTRFYKGMLEGRRLSPAAALRAAQLSMWKDKRWSSPFYWAAFVLHGEYR